MEDNIAMEWTRINPNVLQNLGGHSWIMSSRRSVNVDICKILNGITVFKWKPNWPEVSDSVLC